MNIVLEIKYTEFILWYDIIIYNTVPCPVANPCTVCSVMQLPQPKSGIMMWRE